MAKLPKMVDMSLGREDREEMSKPSLPTFPYGLCISLCEHELEKLDLDDSDLEVGDLLHLHALAKVTSVSSYDNENGSSCRVELQLQYMSIPENESDEDKEAESAITVLYKKK